MMNKEKLFIISHQINKWIYPMAGFKTDKNSGNFQQEIKPSDSPLHEVWML